MRSQKCFCVVFVAAHRAARRGRPEHSITGDDGPFRSEDLQLNPDVAVVQLVPRIHAKEEVGRVGRDGAAEIQLDVVVQGTLVRVGERAGRVVVCIAPRVPP